MNTIYYEHNGRTYCLAPHLDLEQVLELEGLAIKDVRILSDEDIAKMCEAPLEELRGRKNAQINDETSDAITGGFSFTFNSELLQFSYDECDQQNFADTANSVLLNSLNKQEACFPILWKGWRKSAEAQEQGKGEYVQLELSGEQFIELYKEALAHKTRLLALASQRKIAVKNAQSKEELDAI